MLDAINTAYAFFEQFSVTFIISVAIIMSLAFLFSVREAAAWFFKIEDLKKDLRRLSEITLQLEGEVRALQGALGRTKQTSLNVVPTTPSVTHVAAAVEALPLAQTAGTEPAAVKKAETAHFPIVH